MLKDIVLFDRWNTQKKEIGTGKSDILYYPKRREVWMCLLGKNIGSEQNGSGENFSRPVLIVKKFNNRIFWVIPLSSKQKTIDFYYNFTDPEGLGVSLILAQLKLVSVQRLERKLYDFPREEFDSVRTKLKDYL